MAIIDRIKNILLSPKTEWPVIAQESDSISGIYTKYSMLLAAIPAIASFIGMLTVGVGMFGFSYKPSVGSALSIAILTYLLSLAMIYVMSLIINALAPTFDGQKNHLNAFKLAAYSYTASMVAGIAGLVPALWIVGLIGGLYSLYLLYIGLPVLMKNPEHKTLPYFALIFICAIIAGAIMGALTACLAPHPKVSDMGKHGDGNVTINTPAGKVEIQSSGKAKDGDSTVTIKGPGGAEIKVEAKGDKDGNVTINAPGAKVEIDAKKMEEFAKKMEDAAKKMEDAGKSGDSAAALKALQDALGKQAPAKQ